VPERHTQAVSIVSSQETGVEIGVALPKTEAMLCLLLALQVPGEGKERGRVSERE